MHHDHICLNKIIKDGFLTFIFIGLIIITLPEILYKWCNDRDDLLIDKFLERVS